MKHAWLSIAPGIATGWALVSDDGKLIGTSAWGTHELRESLDLLVRQAFTSGWTITVVLEKMPNLAAMGVFGKKLSRVYADVMHVVGDTYELRTVYVAPSAWPKSTAARAARVPATWQKSPVLPRQRDAIRMAHHALEEVPRAA